MSSATSEASVVSCNPGNKKNCYSVYLWILLGLLPKFLGTAFAFVNFLLIKAIDRSPSAVCGVKTFGKIIL